MKLLILKKLSRDLQYYNNFETMKKIVCLFLTLISLSISVCSQTFDRDYFKNNILELDPIEGEYELVSYYQSANAFRIFPEIKEGSRTMTIVSDGYNRFKIVEATGAHSVYFERIGETSMYYHCQYYDAVGWDKTMFTLNNSAQFEFKFEIPDAQLKSDMGRDYQSGFRVSFRLVGVKKYPTSSMYRNALEEAIRIEQERERQKKAEESKPTEWSGTGFALNEGYVVTNYHVVENAKNITIHGVKGDFGLVYEASVVAADRVNDLALLKITDDKFSGFGTIPYKVKTSTSEVGEDVFVLGYPLTSTMGDEIKLTTGIISSKTGFQGDVSMYQISAPIQPGNSGGPLFDSKGNVIGVINAKHIGTENVSYAIKTSYLMNLVESTASSSILPSANSISGLPLTGKVRNVKDFVYMIKCSDENSVNQDASVVEPGTNLNKTLAQIRSMFPDIVSYGGEWYGCSDEGTYYYWWFENNHCIKESMFIEPNYPGDDFPETFYNQLVESFDRSNYKSHTHNFLGHLYEYSYFTIQIQCHNSKTSITYQVK